MAHFQPGKHYRSQFRGILVGRSQLLATEIFPSARVISFLLSRCTSRGTCKRHATEPEDRAHAAHTYVDLRKGARKCGKLLVKRAGCVNSPGNVQVNTGLLAASVSITQTWTVCVPSAPRTRRYIALAKYYWYPPIVEYENRITSYRYFGDVDVKAWMKPLEIVKHCHASLKYPLVWPRGSQSRANNEPRCTEQESSPSSRNSLLIQNVMVFAESSQRVAFACCKAELSNSGELSDSFENTPELAECIVYWRIKLSTHIFQKFYIPREISLPWLRLFGQNETKWYIKYNFFLIRAAWPRYAWQSNRFCDIIHIAVYVYAYSFC